MNPHRRLLWLAMMALAGCGSATVTPLANDAALLQDASAPSPDVAAPRDVPAPPEDRGAPVPDVAPSSIPELCDLACGRQQKDCGTPSERCVESCLRVEQERNLARCRSLVADALRCAGENPFVCRGAAGEPAAVCRDVYQSVDRCLGDRSPPPPIFDAGGTDV